MACTNYSLVNDPGKVIYKEHANTSRVKAVPPLKSISKNMSALPEIPKNK